MEGPVLLEEAAVQVKKAMVRTFAWLERPDCNRRLSLGQVMVWDAMGIRGKGAISFTVYVTTPTFGDKGSDTEWQSGIFRERPLGCRFFGRRLDGVNHRLGPTSEKRPGTKSREMRHC